MNAEKVEVLKAIQQNFDLEVSETVSVEELLLLLEKRIAILVERNPQGFFQLLYRLDISEKRVDQALQKSDALTGIAKLIYDRQLEKIQSRLKYKAKQQDVEKDDELSW